MRHTIAGLLVLSLLAVGSTALAGDAPAAGAVTIEQDAPIALAATVKADLPAGDVAGAFGSLERALGSRVQFVVHASARDVAVPRISVRHSTVIALIDLLGKLVPDLRVRVRIGADLLPAGDVLGSSLADPNWAAEFKSPEETIVVLVNLATTDDRGADIERRLRVYRVATALSDAGVSLDDLATAVETVWEMDPGTHSATLKFHKETGLLICIGTARHLSLAEEVIERLSGSGPASSQAARLADTETLLKKMAIELAAAATAQRAEVAALKTQVAELKAQATDLQKRLEALATKPAAASGAPGR